MPGVRVTSSVRFSPHGIEDILGRNIRTEGGDSERDSGVEIVTPLNLKMALSRILIAYIFILKVYICKKLCIYSNLN